jgi:hypothetical protein
MFSSLKPSGRSNSLGSTGGFSTTVIFIFYFYAVLEE